MYMHVATFAYVKAEIEIDLTQSAPRSLKYRSKSHSRISRHGVYSRGI